MLVSLPLTRIRARTAFQSSASAHQQTLLTRCGASRKAVSRAHAAREFSRPAGVEARRRKTHAASKTEVFRNPSDGGAWQRAGRCRQCGRESESKRKKERNRPTACQVRGLAPRVHTILRHHQRTTATAAAAAAKKVSPAKAGSRQNDAKKKAGHYEGRTRDLGVSTHGKVVLAPRSNQLS